MMKPRTIKFSEETLLIIYGFLGTMPILETFGLTWFSWITLFLVTYIAARWLSGYRISLNKCIYFYLVIFISMMISALTCIASSLPAYWKNTQVNNIVWQICYLLIFIYFSNDLKVYKLKAYLKGIYYAAIFQMFWGFMQWIFYSIWEISINDSIFIDILNMHTESVTQLKGESIALSGLSWNVGSMAPLIIFGYMLSKNISIKLLFILFSAMSGSRTLQLGIVVCILGEFGIFLYNKRKMIKRKNIIIVLLSLFLGILLCLLFPELVSATYNKIEYMLESFSSSTLLKQSSAILHARYLTSIPKVTAWNSKINNLFGYGIGNSGYPFSALYNQYVIGSAWVVECDYVNQLWNYGYVGFVLFYVWFAKHTIKGFIINKHYFLLFMALLVEGITYNVLFNWTYVGLLFLFIMINKGIDLFEVNKPLIQNSLQLKN